MCEVYRKQPADFLVDLISSEMNLARAFVAVSRSAYRLGKMGEGNFARLKAIQLYSEAAKLVAQVEKGLEQNLNGDLHVLSTAISRLFAPSATSEERVFVENPEVMRLRWEGLARGD